MTFAPLALAAFVLIGAEQPTAPLLLDFHASWCPPCRSMRPVVEELKASGYEVRPVDVDSERDLAERYGVTDIPTFIVVDGNGTALARSKGVQTVEELERLFESADARLARREAQPSQAEADAGRADSNSESEYPDFESRDASPLPKPWETVVRIKVRAARAIGFGSGTIIYSTQDESIILTCAHIFTIENARKQYPPKQYPRPVTVDLFDGRLVGVEGKAQRVTASETNIPAELIDYDFNADVALVRIRPGRRLPSTRVVPVGWSPRQGQNMTTVGCSEGADATAWSTEVTSTRIKGLVGNEGYEATECLYAPKQGRSGGGLFTFEEGLVAGVCNFAEPRGKRGLYASPRSIHKILNRNKLQICYDTRKTDPGADNTLLASRRRDEDRRGNNPRANDIVYRSQDPARKPIPMPSPEVLGMDSPNRSLASNPNSGRPPSERSGGWRSESSPERSRSVEMRDEQGGTRSAALNVSPSAVRDPFATVPTEPAAAAQTTEPTTTRSGDALRTDTAKGWKAVRPQ